MVQLTGASASFSNSKDFALGTTNVTGNVALTSTSAGKKITIGSGTGVGAGQNITVGGTLAITTLTTGAILDSDYSAYNIFGGMNLTSASGAITLDAANAVGSFAPRVSFGQVNASTTGAVTLVETTA